MEIKEFIKWYEEAYSSGDTNIDSYSTNVSMGPFPVSNIEDCE